MAKQASTCKSKFRWPIQLGVMPKRVAAMQQKATGQGLRWCGHTRRFNPSHQWVRQRITAGEFAIQQMDVQTYFFRRERI